MDLSAWVHFRPFGEGSCSLWLGPGEGGKRRLEQGRLAWVLSRGPGVVFRMAARDPKGIVCSLIGLSREIRKRMSVIDTGLWRDMRVNAGNMCWLIKSVHSCSLGAHGVLLVKLSHLVEEPNLSLPSDLIRLSA